MKNGTARMPRKRAKRQQPSLTINLRVTAAQGAALSGPGLTVGQSIRALIERATGLPCPKRGRPRIANASMAPADEAAQLRAAAGKAV